MKIEIKGDWPALRAAVNADKVLLQKDFRDYTFTVTFNNNP